MSSRIVVTEGNDVKIINDVSRLVTRLSNGETCNWVQEDSVRLVTKTIIKDGIYIANNDVGSPYGYSQVSVNGVGNKILGQLGEKSITKNGTYEADKDKDGPYYGYSTIVVNVEGGESGDGGGTSRPVVPGKDSDGDDAVVTTDDDGNIVTKKLPSEIKVIVTPDNLEYEDGQSIVFDGLLVKAYYPDGTEYDSIPTTDLIRPVRVAAAEGSGESSSDIYTPSDDIALPSDMTSLVGGNDAYVYSSYSKDWFHFISSGGKSVVIEYNANNSTPIISIICASTNDAITTDRPYGRSVTDSPESGPYSITQWTGNNPTSATQATINERTFYYAVSTLWHYQGDRQYNIGVDNSTDATINFSHIAYILLYGNYNPGGSIQTIPLQWERPGDKKVLETSFTITVHASDDSGDSGGSGGSSDPQPQPTPPPS